jgi:hypothetical protein
MNITDLDNPSLPLDAILKGFLEQKLEKAKKFIRSI